MKTLLWLALFALVACVPTPTPAPSPAPVVMSDAAPPVEKLRKNAHRRSRFLSRVLFRSRGGDHSSRPCVAARLERQPGGSEAGRLG